MFVFVSCIICSYHVLTYSSFILLLVYAYLQIQKASHGGEGGGKGKGHDQSKYESTAAELGGGGGGSGDGRWGDGLAKVLERGVGLDAAEFDVSCAFYQKFCAMCILFGRMICSIDLY